jgi:hypothetical protein
LLRFVLGLCQWVFDLPLGDHALYSVLYGLTQDWPQFNVADAAMPIIIARAIFPFMLLIITSRWLTIAAQPTRLELRYLNLPVIGWRLMLGVEYF